MIKVNIHELKKVIDKMADDNINNRDAMSSRIAIQENNGAIEIIQFCEYAECFPNRKSIKQLS